MAVNRRRADNVIAKKKEQKEAQLSTKHCRETYKLRNTNTPRKTR